jgi:hypothetical protein
MAAMPPVTLVRQFDTHRLVASRHEPRGESVLAAIADEGAELQAIFELDAATDDRLLARERRLPGIGPEELVFEVPHAAVVNAAFCHAHPLGGRFNGPDRGARYAAFDLDTSQKEVGFHKSVQLAEIGRFDDSVTYDEYLADVSASLHDLRRARGLRRLARRRLPERPARGRHVPGVLPPGAGRQRPAREGLPLHVVGNAGTCRNGRAVNPAGLRSDRIYTHS